MDTPYTSTGYLAWIKAHEKLVIVGIAAFLLFHFCDAGLKAWQQHDQLIAQASAQLVTVDHQNNQLLQTQLEKLQQQVASQQAALDIKMQQRVIKTVEQKKVDAVMTPTELAARFQLLLKVAPQEVTSAPVSGNLVFTPVAAQANVDSLEDLERFKQDNTDLKTELSSQMTLLDKQTGLLNGVEKELTDEKKSHQDDINLYKVKAKKSWLSGFKVGVVVGIIGGEAIRLILHKP